jgi:Na+/proline symporter/nitrogen-specific signal transduction histidine kinase
MLQGWVILVVSFAYLGVLFAIAYYGDKRADVGRSIISNPYIYALSLAVYCTSWTFYGSVGRAANSGIGFLPIYLGPTLIAILWWLVLRKIIRISKTYRITSIADFIASRYGKSTRLGGLVTIVAVVGILPYIALQLKAVANSFTILLQYPAIVMPTDLEAVPVLQDTTFYIALLLAAFTILFGTRHLDATERHEGMVAAIAFESVVKLLAFLAVGAFVTFGLYRGFGDLFATAQAADLQQLLTFEATAGSYGGWAGLILLSMLAIMFLPRQFQVAVVENVDEAHVNKAVWLFPVYLVAINIFVLPITFAGLLQFAPGQVDADYFVLTLPMLHQQEFLALFVFIGGMSAATGMVIVETIALSTMVSNDLVMPVLLRLKMLRLTERADLSGLLLLIRRGAIVLVLLLGYGYFRLIGEEPALVSIGLVSFAAVAQFAPAILGGIFWKNGNRRGALIGLGLGFLVWGYTLFLPSLAQASWFWVPRSLVEVEPFSIALLKPYALFGLEGLDHVSHTLIWSLLLNVGGYIGGSLLSRPSAAEHSQAVLFVDVFQHADERGSRFWRGTASVADLHTLLSRFLGAGRAKEAFTGYAHRLGLRGMHELQADAEFVHFAETQLAGTIGSASARVMVASAVKEEPLGTSEVMDILEEASQVRAYSRQLEQKSRELEAATTELRELNQQLQELDQLKDDFISTVTHELRTPLTSIRAFSEILLDTPDMEIAQRSKFLTIIVKESERLTRLINQVLDLSKIESGNVKWHITEVDLREVVEDGLTATSQLFNEQHVEIQVDLPDGVFPVLADRDRLMQVMLNLLSNAVKFCDHTAGLVQVNLRTHDSSVCVQVRDNGPGIKLEDQQIIFDKFRQVGDTMIDKPQGTGLGLPISRQIMTHFGGELWVESTPGAGATFAFTLPFATATCQSPLAEEGSVLASQEQEVVDEPA